MFAPFFLEERDLVARESLHQTSVGMNQRYFVRAVCVRLYAGARARGAVCCHLSLGRTLATASIVPPYPPFTIRNPARASDAPNSSASAQSSPPGLEGRGTDRRDTGRVEGPGLWLRHGGENTKNRSHNIVRTQISVRTCVCAYLSLIVYNVGVHVGVRAPGD